VKYLLNETVATLRLQALLASGRSRISFRNGAAVSLRGDR
jgi:hypothetical protein